VVVAGAAVGVCEGGWREGAVFALAPLLPVVPLLPAVEGTVVDPVVAARPGRACDSRALSRPAAARLSTVTQRRITRRVVSPSSRLRWAAGRRTW